MPYMDEVLDTALAKAEPNFLNSEYLETRSNFFNDEYLEARDAPKDYANVKSKMEEKVALDPSNLFTSKLFSLDPFYAVTLLSKEEDWFKENSSEVAKKLQTTMETDLSVPLVPYLPQHYNDNDVPAEHVYAALDAFRDSENQDIFKGLLCQAVVKGVDANVDFARLEQDISKNESYLQSNDKLQSKLNSEDKIVLKAFGNTEKGFEKDFASFIHDHVFNNKDSLSASECLNKMEEQILASNITSEEKTSIKKDFIVGTRSLLSRNQEDYDAPINFLKVALNCSEKLSLSDNDFKDLYDRNERKVLDGNLFSQKNEDLSNAVVDKLVKADPEFAAGALKNAWDNYIIRVGGLPLSHTEFVAKKVLDVYRETDGNKHFAKALGEMRKEGGSKDKIVLNKAFRRLQKEKGEKPIDSKIEVLMKNRNLFYDPSKAFSRLNSGR